MGLKLKHSFECEKKHRWDASLYSVKKGSWCKMCDKNEKLDQLKIFAGKKNGQCLSTEYVSTVDKLIWKCDRGHVWEAKPHHILNGTWCPNCAGIENWKKRNK